MDTGQRTVIKAVLWNVIGLSMMAFIGILFTGSIAIGGTIALANTLIGFLSYLIYERVWARISWGRR